MLDKKQKQEGKAKDHAWTMTKILRCRSLQKREITLPNCRESEPEHCKRTYYLYLPTVLCHSGARRTRRAGSATTVDDERDSGGSVLLRRRLANDNGSLMESRGDDGDNDGDQYHGIIHRHALHDEYFDGEYNRVGTLPVVFAFHGYGEDGV